LISTTMNALILTTLLIASAGNVAAQPATAAAAAPGKPAPVLVFTGAHDVEVNGQFFTRYELVVANAESYSDVLFAPSADLPPCGNNPQAARTWLDIYDGAGARIYGFCAIGRNHDLRLLWFALPKGATPPPQVYLEMKDRLLGTVYRSQRIALALPAPAKP
jgi:hypothetical protein